MDDILGKIKELNANSGYRNPYYEYTHGKCLVFALMLEQNFKGQIIYLPEVSHFVFMYNSKLYDTYGNVTKKFDGCRRVIFEDLSEKMLRHYQTA